MDKKNLILKGAFKIFSKYGYENTKVEDISDYLNIAKGTIYYYFDSKDKLFNEVIKFSLNEFNKNIENAVIDIIKNNSEIKEWVFNIVDVYIDIFRNNKNLFKLIEIQKFKFPQYFKKNVLKFHFDSNNEIIKNEITKKINIKNKYNFENIGIFIRGILNSFLFKELFLNHKITNEEKFEIKKFILYGLIGEEK